MKIMSNSFYKSVSIMVLAIFFTIPVFSMYKSTGIGSPRFLAKLIDQIGGCTCGDEWWEKEKNKFECERICARYGIFKKEKISYLLLDKRRRKRHTKKLTIKNRMY